MIPAALARRLALLAVGVVLVGACGAATTPTGGASTTPSAAEPSEAGATPEPAATAEIEAILRGDWRRLPLDPRSFAGMARLDATCRAAEPAIGSLPLAVTDARGGGRLVLVYASLPTSAAWECRASLDAATAAEVDVLALQASGEPLGDADIDVRHYEAVEHGGETAIVAVGRIGRLADEAIAQFDTDESYIYASIGGGWWAMWWPGTEGINGIGATDTHNVVIGSAQPVLPVVP